MFTQRALPFDNLLKVDNVPYILVMLTALFWASNFIAAKIVGPSVPPVTLTLLRWLTASVLMLPFALPWIIKNRDHIKKHAFYLCMMGLLSTTLFNSFLYAGIQTTEANKASILQSLTPVVIMLICGLALNEKIRIWQWVGVFLSFSGVIVLVSHADVDRLIHLSFASGDLYLLGSVLCWATYSIALRWRPPVFNDFTFFAVISIFGTVGLFPLSLYELSDRELPTLDAKSIATIFYIAIFPSILAGVFWNKSVISLGASTAGLFTYVIPIYTFILSAIFLGEGVENYHIIGLATILTGVFCATRLGRTT